jgi:hypothetical protein
MKKITPILVATIALCAIGCKKATPTENEVIKELEIKLTATEAQLINVSAELARCKGTEEAEKVDSTQFD